MSFNYCTSAAIIAKAGINCNQYAATSQSILAGFCDYADALIDTSSRYNFSGAYSTIAVNIKPILTDTASSLAAINLIAYDMSGYTSRGEAESMITILRDGALRNLAILRDKKVQDFM